MHYPYHKRRNLHRPGFLGECDGYISLNGVDKDWFFWVVGGLSAAFASALGVAFKMILKRPTRPEIQTTVDMLEQRLADHAKAAEAWHKESREDSSRIENRISELRGELAGLSRIMVEAMTRKME